MEKISESLENYLRIIYEVQSQKDFARVKDITSRLNVKTASVADALKSLVSLVSWNIKNTGISNSLRREYILH